ncbi:hypothetical protein ABZ920_20005 [Streptomyces sp. NPDC046831]|uniref:hypothetical protein n=1 Tax=Streptomyces sp. NPDC046831 TaxID=3154805 RepID=UPI0033D4ACFB
MDTNQLQGLIGMAVVVGLLAFLVAPSVIGIAHDRRVDRRIREAERARQARAASPGGTAGGDGGTRAARGDRGARETERSQKSSSSSTVPSTATWYAEGRRSKKLVSS